MSKIIITVAKSLIRKVISFYKGLISFNNLVCNHITIFKNKVKVSGRWKIYGRISISNNGEITIGNELLIYSGGRYNPVGGYNRTQIICLNGAIIDIKDHVGISNSTIYCAKYIRIEDNVSIGGGCKIFDTDFHSIDPNIRRTKRETLKDIKTNPITIKKNAWIGGYSIILKGVVIGENAVIGAGSVVTTNVPDNEIWAGNPARFIKKIN